MTPPPLKKSRFHFSVKNDTQCSETNEKSLIRFLVYEIWSILYSTFVMNWDVEPDSEMQTSDTREPVGSRDCAYFRTVKILYLFRVYRDDLKSTISQKLKIRKLIFHSFQDIACHFGLGIKKTALYKRGGGGSLHIVN